MTQKTDQIPHAERNHGMSRNRYSLPSPETALEMYLGRLSAGSRQSQLSALDQVAALLSDGEMDAAAFRWHEMTVEDVAAVRSWLVETYKPRTARRMLSAVREILRSCWRIGLIDAETLARLLDHAPVRGGGNTQTGRALSKTNLRDLEHRLTSSPNWFRIRNLAILRAGYLAGLRVVELHRLNREDVDLDEAVLQVHGKGGVGRRIPIGTPLADALAEWIKERGSDDSALFISVDHDGTSRRLSRTAISKLIRRIGDAAGVKLTPHDLRRTFATNLLESGVDLETVRRLMGHADPRTTGFYDRRGFDGLRRAVGLLEAPPPGLSREDRRRVGKMMEEWWTEVNDLEGGRSESLPDSGN